MKYPTSLVTTVIAASLLIVDHVTGQEVLCNEVYAYNNGTECVCNTHGLIYDYGAQDCKSKSDLYNTEDFCGYHAKTDGTGGCTCAPGYQLSSDGVCSDVIEDVCSAVSCPSAPLAEVCMPSDGLRDESFICSCPEGYYRSDAGSDCSTLDQASNHHWNDCPHYAINDNDKYTCECYDDNYYEDVGGDGRNCTLDTENYSVHHEDNCTIYLQTNNNPDGEELIPLIKQGCTKNESHVMDRDECSKESTYTCWANSHCLNLPDGQGYDCICDPGYTDYMFGNHTENRIRQCNDKKCPLGPDNDIDSPECVKDPCLALETSGLQVCLPTSPYVYTIRTTISLPTVNKVQATLTVINAPQPVTAVMNALDSLLDAGVSEASTSDGTLFSVTVGLFGSRMSQFTADQVNSLLSASCVAANITDAHCYLPHGIIVSSGFNFECIDPCPADCGDLNCSPASCGKYTCECTSGLSTGEFVDGYREICSYESMLDSLEASEEHYKNCTIALGVCFGLTALAFLGYAIFTINQNRK